jgi:prolyl oligopeptidase
MFDPLFAASFGFRANEPPANLLSQPYDSVQYPMNVLLTPSRRCAVFCLLFLGLVSSFCNGAKSLAAPPLTPIIPVVDNYFGQSITDNYRWLEDLSSPQTVAWFKAQADYTNAILVSVPHRADLLARISALDSSTTTYESVSRVGSRLFYEKLSPTDQTPKLFVRDGLAGKERLLLDPGQFATGAVHEAIDYYAPSLEGHEAIVGISPGGSENSTMLIVNADTGLIQPDRIDRARFGSPSWLPGGHSFFYNRLPAIAPGADPELAEEKSQVFLHVIGRDPDNDPAVFGYGLSPLTNSSIEPEAISVVTVSPASPYAIGTVEHGVQNELTLYVTPLSKIDGASTPWVKLVDVNDDVTGYDIKGSTVFLLTHKGASRYKVVSIDAAHPNFAVAKQLVPPSAQVIQSVAVAKDALYITSLDGGIGKLASIGFDGGTLTPVKLPYAGTIADSSIDARLPGVWVELTGWTESALWYSYDPKTKLLTNTGLKKRSKADFSGIVAVEAQAKAADGTLIPLSIIYPKNFKLDGSHPAICEAYGAYGITMNPGFNPTLLAWFDHGGVYAVAHVRGGGEFGEDWHNAGKGLTKPNTWNDLIACSEYLIKHGYTSPSRLAIEGGSAGGITVGRALTERPDLFGVVIDEVGASDALRQQFSPNGPANIPEFGDVTTADGFKALYAMDAYMHVTPGVKYPAVLLTTGINDPRVAPWEPGKMTSALQASTTSGKPVLLRVDYDAGHGIGSDRSQSEKELADQYAFALWQLGNPNFQPAP